MTAPGSLIHDLKKHMAPQDTERETGEDDQSAPVYTHYHKYQSTDSV